MKKIYKLIGILTILMASATLLDGVPKIFAQDTHSYDIATQPEKSDEVMHAVSYIPDNTLKEEYVISAFEPTFVPPSVSSRQGDYGHFWTFYDAADVCRQLVMSGDGSTIVLRMWLNYNRTMLFSIQGNQPLWETPHGQLYWTSGISYDGSVIILYDDNNFYRVTKESYQPVWIYPRDGGVGGGMVTPDGLFVFFTQGSNIFKLDIETLDTLWTASVDECTVGSIWWDGNDSIIATNSTAVYLFDGSTGSRLWRRPFYWNPPYYMKRTISIDGSIIVTKKDGIYPPTPATYDAWIKVYKWSEELGEYQFCFESIFDYGEFLNLTLAMSISPENTRLVVASDDRTDNPSGGNDFLSATVRMFDLVNNTLIWERRWFPEGIVHCSTLTAKSASFSLDGSRVAMGFGGDEENIMDDFLIFDSESPDELFALNSPGSSWRARISEDGNHAVAAADAMPGGTPGMGAYLYTVVTESELGNITGVVDIEHTENDSGAIVSLEYTDRCDTTDASGNYLIEHVLEGNRNLIATKDPWYVPEIAQVEVTGGATVTVDFLLQSTLPAPENLVAGDNFQGYVPLTWSPSQGMQWPKEWIFYDDESFESGIASTGGSNLTAMRFTPIAYPAVLDSVKFFVFDYGTPTQPVDIYIIDDDGAGGWPGTPIAGPYNISPTGPGWTYLDLPDTVVIDSGDFYVSAFYIEPNGPYIGLDTGLEYYYDRNWWGWQGPPPCNWMCLGDLGIGSYDYDLGYRALVEVHSLEYKVYRGNQSGGPYELIANIVAPDTTYIDSNVTAGNTYWYVVSAYYPPDDVESDFSNEDSGSPSVGVEDPNPQIPKVFTLRHNYPNPFNPQTTILYALPKSCKVSLNIYNIKGQLVESLVNEVQLPGNHSVVWNVEDASSGIYLYRITAGDFTDTRKCVILK